MTETGESPTMNWQKAINFPEEMLEEAASWHARITDDAASEDVWLSFTEWLEAHEHHRLAYDKVEELSFELETLAEPAKRLMEDEKTDPSEAADNVIHAAWRWKNRNVWGGLAAAAAAVMLVLANVGLFNEPAVITQEYLTGFGEQKIVQLDDGSTVHLNTNSKLLVTFEESRRYTQLAQGEALFSVAKNRERPFFVAVGDRKVRVVGTKFNVLRHANHVTVTVAEGIVDVSANETVVSLPSRPTSRLIAGKQLVHKDGAPNSQITDVDADAILSWETGILAYDEAPLVYTIGELSRYFERPFRIEGDVSHITFSGVLNIRDQDAVLQLLEETLPISITRDEGVIIVSADK